MPVIQFVTGKLDDAARRKSLFDGGFVVFKDVPAMKELCELADTMARAAFGGDFHPSEAYRHFEKADFVAIVEPLQRKFTNDETARNLFRRALDECGVDLPRTYWDWFPLRIQPGETSHDSMSTAGLHAHRDSWYSNMYAQTNWWAPIYPLEAERAVAFHPIYYDRPVANNSDGWDLQEFRAARAEVRARNGSTEEVRNAYPAIRPTEPIDTSSELVFVIEPGDLLNFSLAHLHESIPNSTDRARFSTEIRTLHLDDVMARTGAPNVDSRSTGDAFGDFFHMTDNQRIVDAMQD
jgi:hypothetical protein